MNLRKETGGICLTRRNGYDFARADGMVGLEAVEEYLHLLYPAYGTSLRDSFLEAIQASASGILRLMEEGGALTNHGGIADKSQLEVLSPELMDKLGRQRFITIRDSALYARFDPESFEKIDTRKSQICLFAPDFRDGVGYVLIPKGERRFYVMPYWESRGKRHELPVASLANAVDREYVKLGIHEKPIITPTTVATQLIYDIARIWGKGQIPHEHQGRFDQV